MCGQTRLTNELEINNRVSVCQGVNMRYLKRLKLYKKYITLRKSGMSYRSIGEVFGVTGEAVRNKINLGEPKKIITRVRSLQVRSGRDLTREMARIRDKHTCRGCGKKWKSGSRAFDVHHLNGLCGKKSHKYDRVSEIGGLITLCHKCHFNRHDFSINRDK